MSVDCIYQDRGRVYFMATLEVRIKYETVLSKTLYWGLILLSPVWALLPLLLLLCMFFTRGTDHIFMLAGYYSICLPITIVGLYLWFYLRDNRLVLTQQGICFPASIPSLIGKRNCPWYRLTTARVLGPAMESEQGNFKKYTIRLQYAHRTVDLSLKNFSFTEAEQLILGLETFAGSANGVETLPELKKILKSELKIKGIKSYTNLWDDELRYRYASTTFIPLSPNTFLQEGEIKVLRQLGFGGLSAIYLVQRKKQDLAILKESVLPADVDDDLKAKAEEQFNREARILAGLDHPQIARVLDHFVERGHYLLLEYVHGQDLRQYVAEHGALKENLALDFALQIAGILNYLHTREPAIIHRDLTPENLIVNDRGKIVLIDFGAANEFLHTATGTLVGKHAYMAPEQLKGKAQTQSDLYSLGCTLHFLLTGQDPVPLSSSRPKSINPSVTPSTDELVFHLTQLNIRDRTASPAALQNKLAELAEKQGAS